VYGWRILDSSKGATQWPNAAKKGTLRGRGSVSAGDHSAAPNVIASNGLQMECTLLPKAGSLVRAIEGAITYEDVCGRVRSNSWPASELHRSDGRVPLEGSGRDCLDAMSRGYFLGGSG